jgi:hypothetical protein
MERAFRRLFWHTDGIFIYTESAGAAIPVVYQMEIRIRGCAKLPPWLGVERTYQAMEDGLDIRDGHCRVALRAQARGDGSGMFILSRL